MQCNFSEQVNSTTKKYFLSYDPRNCLLLLSLSDVSAGEVYFHVIENTSCFSVINLIISVFLQTPLNHI